MSVRRGDRLIITRHSSQLGQLTAEDLIETGLHKDDSNIRLVSSETPVHRAIYFSTAALAIVHAHPKAAIAFSLLQDEIVPVDREGSYLLHKVPVISSAIASGTELAEVVATALKRDKIVMVRGHGCFSTGQLLEEAYHWVSCLEESSQILYYRRTIGGDMK
jgi:L-fuculose-phosphate aldolase